MVPLLRHKVGSSALQESSAGMGIMSYDLSPPFLVLQSPRLPYLSNYITPTFYRRHVPDLQTTVSDMHLSSRLWPIMFFQGAMLSLQSGEWCDCLNILCPKMLHLTCTFKYAAHSMHSLLDEKMTSGTEKFLITALSFLC